MKQALLDHKNLSGIRLRAQDVEVVDRDKMRILAPQRNQHGVGARLMYFHLQNIKKALPKAVVTGIRSTNRAVINKDDKGDKTTYSLLVEGYGLMDVMSVPGIDSVHTSSNHVMEVERVLGIEAARCTIMKEIQLTMGSHGIGIDTRHVQMLGDCMTYRGMVLGINRFGISRIRTSALMLASFEPPQTTSLTPRHICAAIPSKGCPSASSSVPTSTLAPDFSRFCTTLGVGRRSRPWVRPREPL